MTEFEEIRPYLVHEVSQAANKLATDNDFIEVLNKFYPNTELRDQALQHLTKITSIDEFQADLIVPVLQGIQKSTTDGLSFSAMEQFSKEENYLIISNHRDIILDPAFLNLIMHENGLPKTEVAIGDNLLIYDWIKKLVRLNRCFIVNRNLGIREQLSASKKLSSYIRHTVTEKGENVWIAQREGRTKNGDDQMQPALLKMLLMSGGKNMEAAIRELKIVPMAISYEIEPCIVSKVEELLKKKHNPEFTKSQADDLRSMANGILNPKGRVHFGFGNPVNSKLHELCEGKKNNEVLQSVVEYINKRIYFNYKLWPNNYIAYDLLYRTNKYTKQYSSAELLRFKELLKSDLAQISFEEEEATQLYLEIYSNPVLNLEKTS